MPLDTSTYALALLRVDGRRWNELRRLRAQIRTQSAADGSSYLEMGHTKVICVVRGPSESSGGGGGGGGSSGCDIDVHITVAGFSSVDRKRRGWRDKRIAELSHTLKCTLLPVVQTHLFPHSTLSLHLMVLSQDGSLLAVLTNAATLALADAGVPMTAYVAACTSGSTSSHAAADDAADPLLDLNQQEEQELPFVTVATLGDADSIAMLVCESRVQVSRLEGMLAVAVDGCRQVRELLDRVVREKGKRMIADGTIARGEAVDSFGIGDEMEDGGGTLG